MSGKQNSEWLLESETPVFFDTVTLQPLSRRKPSLTYGNSTFTIDSHRGELGTIAPRASSETSPPPDCTKTMTKPSRCNKSSSWKLMIAQFVNIFPAFYETWRFITVFIRVRHRSLSWLRWIQSTHSHPHFLKIHLNITPHLRLNPPSHLFPASCPAQILLAFVISPMRATFPVHLILRQSSS
jgi:hypothetical protein